MSRNDLRRYIGPVAQLLFTLLTFLCTLYFFFGLGHIGGGLITGAITLVQGYIIAANDWPKVWGPLFFPRA